VGLLEYIASCVIGWTRAFLRRLLIMTATRAWVYPTLVVFFVAFMAAVLNDGDRRFGPDRAARRPAVTGSAESAPAPGAAPEPAPSGAASSSRPAFATRDADTPWLMALVTTSLTGPMVDFALAWRPDEVPMGPGGPPSGSLGGRDSRVGRLF
jgi:hypothetical protein